MSSVSERSEAEAPDEVGSTPDPHGSPAHGGLRFRPDIEGLRAVAVLMVVLSHLSVPWFGSGFIGVDVFFVISGFLITSLLVKEYSERKAETGSGRISIIGFYRRRALRILPAALFVIAAVLIAAKLLLNRIAFVRVQADALWATLFATNLQLIRESTDYFQAGLSKSPLQNYWSLAVEEQFYLVWPLCFALVAAAAVRWGRGQDWLRSVRAAVAVIGLASFGWSVHASSAEPTAGYFSTFTRAWQLALGALIALSPGIAPRMRGKGALAAGLTGLLLLGLGLSFGGVGVGYPGFVGLFPTVGAALLICAGLSGARMNLAGRLLSMRGPRAIGRISYSLYLWHWPLIIFSGFLYGESAQSPAARTALLLLSIGAATASYFAIERPFIALGRNGIRRTFREKALPPLRLAALVAVPALSVVVIAIAARPIDAQRPGIPVAGSEVPRGTWLRELREAARQTRITKSEERIAKALVERQLVSAESEEESRARPRAAEGGRECRSVNTVTTYRQAARCSAYGKGLAGVSWPSSVKPKAALIGNSFAGQWIYELIRILPRDVMLVPLTVTSCRPWDLEDTGQRDSRGYSCDDHRDHVFRSLRRARPGLAIVSYQRVMKLDNQLEATTALVRKLRKEVPNVLFIGPAPILVPFDRCLTSKLRAASCNRLISWRERNGDEQFAKAVRAGGGHYISTQKLMCTRVVCPAFINGRPTRFDGIHATRWTARGVGLFLADAVERSVALPGTASKSYSR